MTEIRKELAVKNSVLLSQEGNQHGLKSSNSRENALPHCGSINKTSSEEVEPKDIGAKHSSDIEVGRQNSFILSFVHYLIFQDINHKLTL